MVVIFSDSQDSSTTNVMKWLYSLGEEVSRINENEFISFYQNFYSCKKRRKTIKSIWIRRWNREKVDLSNLNENISEDLKEKTTFFIEGEINAIKENFVKEFEGFVLGNWERASVNKLNILNCGKKIGFNIPPYKIISQRYDLYNFIKLHGKIITKAAFEGLSIYLPNIGAIMNYTETIDIGYIETLPEFFFPSFVQKRIEKDFEVRIYFMCNQIYSVAMFSQLDKKTTIDFRRYNTKKKARTIPFVIPDNLKAKIISFMKLINLNCGSLDFIKGIDGKFYFLEINPVGQYGMVSYPGNFKLDKVIAKLLSNGGK